MHTRVPLSKFQKLWVETEITCTKNIVNIMQMCKKKIGYNISMHQYVLIIVKYAPMWIIIS
jgi:hypothetical protein